MRKALAVILVCCAIAVSRCGYMVDEDHAVRAVTNLGFTEVKIEGKAVFFLEYRGCSKSDDAGFTVSGKNPQGRRVTLLVCVGWPFKGATVRSL